MTAYTKTIANNVRFFGIEPTEKWATYATSTSNLSQMVWGTDYWAFGTVGMSYVWTQAASATTGLTATITNTLGLGSAVYKVFRKGLPNTFSASNTVGKGFSKYVSNSQIFTSTVGFTSKFNRTISDDITITDSISRDASYNILYGNDLAVVTSQDVFLKRDNYTVIVGGKSNVTEWPRSSSWTIVARPT